MVKHPGDIMTPHTGPINLAYNTEYFPSGAKGKMKVPRTSHYVHTPKVALADDSRAPRIHPALRPS
jgi:hypothetical protein